MTKTFFLVLCSFSTIQAFSQCIANAGSDTVICKKWNGFDTIHLGATPVVTGGVAPYTYSWKSSYQTIFSNDTFNLSASNLLNDTTIAKPVLISPQNDTMKFILEIYDSQSNYCTDSVTVIPSVFKTSFYSYTYDITLSDTIGYYFLPNLSGGIPPLDYLWQPNEGLIDSTSYTGILASPDTSTSYYLTITDSAGCKVSATPCFNINVGYAPLSKQEKVNVKLYPNPSDGFVQIQTNKSVNIDKIFIYQINGNLEKFITKDFSSIDLSDLPDGHYLFEIKTNYGTIRKSVVLY